MPQLAITFPLALGDGGDTLTTASETDAAEQLIEQLLFTSPGERLAQPDLGCGLLKLLFDPTSHELRAATEFQVGAELQHWLGDVVRIVSVVVSGNGAEVDVVVEYQLAASATTHTVAFRR